MLHMHSETPNPSIPLSNSYYQLIHTHTQSQVVIIFWGVSTPLGLYLLAGEFLSFYWECVRRNPECELFRSVIRTTVNSRVTIHYLLEGFDELLFG